jgi:TonB-linked SusC/RagA family outer membrane protein
MKGKNFTWKLFTAMVLLLSLALKVEAQEGYRINSMVVDKATGEPLIGVSVVERGTTRGVATDVSGAFTLLATSADADVVFSYIGYTTLALKASEVPVKVALEEETTELSDVVVIGYGTQTKKEITGSVASIKEESFNKGIQSNPMGLIQGKVAGLTIIKNGGDDPAQNSYQVQLRGVGSLKGNSAPLYIIDGVPGGDMASVLPADIESIDVLKDGSAAAIYGTRANHGVILITTKRGKAAGQGGASRAVVEYSGDVATGFIAKRPRVLTADEYRTYMVNNSRGTDLGGNTTWLDEITRTPISHTHALSMAGGSETFNYRASVGYRNMQGVAIKSDYSEINGRFAADQKALNNKLHLSYDFSYTSNKRNWADYDVFNQAIRLNPTMPVRSDIPDYKKYHGYYETNAFYSYNAVAKINETDNNQNDKVLLGSIRAALSITDHLQFSTFYSLQQKSVWNGKYESRYLKSVLGLNGVATQSEAKNQMQVIENTLQYVNSFDRHNLQAFVGQSYQYTEDRSFNVQNTDFPLDHTSYNNLGMGAGVQTGEPNKVSMGSSRYADKLSSFFARVLYNYADKYYFNASARMEGSSKFGPKADPTFGRWGIFPAVSASWRISEEEFMQGISVLNDLKIRAGYGVTGNMPSDHYLYLMRVGQTGSEIFIDGAFVKPWGALSNENEYLRWEKKHEYNVGLDFTLFNKRLSGTIDAYLRNTIDLLWEYNVPMPPYPYGTKWDNYGQLRNMGVELALNYAIFREKDYAWNVGVVMAKNSNKVIKITGGEYADNNAGYLDVGSISSGDGETGVNVMRLAEGEPIGNFYGWKYAGIKSDGTWMFYTPEGGFTSSPTEANKQILGNAQPFATFGFNTAASYRQFDLSLNFRGQFGGLIFNEMRYFYENTTGAENVLLSAVSSSNKIAANRDASKLNANRRFSNFYLEDATFIKLSDVTLSYTVSLPENVQKYISRLKFNLTAQNLFTITGYSGMDPEVNMSGLTPGFDGRSYYPHQRTVLFGASLMF